MKRILFVEDEEIMTKLFQMEVDDYDSIEADYAENGAEALDLIWANEYNVLLTDLSMPIMGGIELLEEIRNKKISIPHIYVLSGNPKKMYEEKLDELGITSFIQKPYDIEELLKMIESL